MQHPAQATFPGDPVGGIHDQERERIERHYAGGGKPADEVLREAGRALSRLSSYAGVVMAPRFSATTFRRIDFVPLSAGRVLAIIVSQAGMIQNKIVETGETFTAVELELMTAYLNRTLDGLPIDRVRERIAADMAAEKAQFDRLQRRALALSQQALTSDEGKPLFRMNHGGLVRSE